MKNLIISAALLFFLMIAATTTAQLIPVTNWYHAGDQDWVTISNNSPTPQQLESWGYIQPNSIYQAWASNISLANGRLSNNMIAIYRWYHPVEKDWVTLPENYGTDESLIRAGYKDKLFLFYAYPIQQPGTIRVNLWYHPGEKDYVSLSTDYGTDAGLIQAGYEKRVTGFFYAWPITK